MKRPNLRIIRIEENEDSQLKGPEIVFNKIIEENFSNLKKVMAIKVQEVYRTPNQLMGPEKKIFLSHNNKDTKFTEKRKNIKCHR